MVSGQIAMTSHLAQGFLAPAVEPRDGKRGSLFIFEIPGMDSFSLIEYLHRTLALYIVWELRGRINVDLVLPLPEMACSLQPVTYDDEWGRKNREHCNKEKHFG